ncbi:Septin-type guanine nucleotide-binding (G) domain-containing protein [Paraphysoderma sedebokerense]|nr:Septin-type guanine nucleotide-binding (G) domain-containing protein [Paraphysoderma sedebokerense]
MSAMSKTVQTAQNVEKAALTLRTRRKRIGIPLNLMIVGREGVGKTSFISTLHSSLSLAGHIVEEGEAGKSAEKLNGTPFGNVKVHPSVEVSLTGGNVVLTLIDTPGLPYGEKESKELAEILGYIEGQFEGSLIEELKVRRNPKAMDTHVHVILYFIMPNKEGIHPHDIYAMSKLSHRANVIPCLGMADSITTRQLANLKQAIMKVLQDNSVPILKFTPDPTIDGDILTLSDAEDEDLLEETSSVLTQLPFTVINSEPNVELTNSDGKNIVGREYPWGIIDCDNEDHCDLTMIKYTVLASHLGILKSFTRDVLYERYRTERLLAHKMLMEEKTDREE